VPLGLTYAGLTERAQLVAERFPYGARDARTLSS